MHIHRLQTKLSLVLLSLLALLAVLIVSHGYRLAQDYHDELTQELNKNIATYINETYRFMQGQGDDEATLRMLAQRAMTVNPSVEVYLLDAEGRILRHMGSADTEIKQPVIELEPVLRFISGEARFPIKASDPINADVKKIFAAHEIYKAGELQGYVYVILGGRLYDTLAERISGSYVLKTALGVLLLMVLFSGVLGILLFKSLTARLDSLVNAVRGFDPEQSVCGGDLQLVHRVEKDEIDVLNNTLLRMQQQISCQIESLKTLDQQRRELIYNISHDLRTPLATIQGYVETLLIKGDSLGLEERESYLKISQRSTQQLNRLISDLFELSRLESGQAELQPEAFSVMELIYDTVQEFKLTAAQKDICIYTPSPTQDIKVFADISLIQRVLANLLSNAIRFTPREGNISIGIKPVFKAISIMVRDTGEGITERDMSRIFERHYSTASAADGGNTSTGLGLTIVNKILELHNSSLAVGRNTGHGSNFRFRLPIVERRH